MYANLTEFIEAASNYYKQNNFVQNSEAWENVCRAAKPLAGSAESSIGFMEDKNGLLLCIALYNEGKERNQLLKILFNKALQSQPDGDFINALSLLSQDEIINNILPFVYEAGSRSSVTVYLAAKLGVLLSSSVFPNFLTTHQWEQTDLINLSILVTPNEKDELIDILSKELNKASVKASGDSQLYEQFIHILLNTNASEPLLPNVAAKGKSFLSQPKSNLSNNNLSKQPEANNNAVNRPYRKYSLEKQTDSENKKFALTSSKPTTNDKSTNSTTTVTVPKQIINNPISSTNNVKTQPQANEIKNDLPKTQTQSKQVKAKPVEKLELKNNTNNKDSKPTVKQSTEQTNKDKANSNSNNKIVISSKSNKNAVSTNASEKIIESMNSFFDSFKSKSANVDVSDFYSKNKVGIITFIFIILGGTLIMMMCMPKPVNTSVQEPPVPSKPAAINAKNWVDIETNKVIDEKYIRADTDYRLGELYLTRDKYHEALKCFNEALAVDKSHLNSLIKSAHCYINIGDFSNAIQNLNIALKLSPRGEFINMYMARAYKAQHDSKKAMTFYEKELKLNMNLTVALEYANFLKKIGESNKSMELLSKLQSMYPDKSITLDDDEADS